MIKELKKLRCGKIIENVDLKKYTTYKLDERAKFLIIVDNFYVWLKYSLSCLTYILISKGYLPLGIYIHIITFILLKIKKRLLIKPLYCSDFNNFLYNAIFYHYIACTHSSKRRDVSSINADWVWDAAK